MITGFENNSQELSEDELSLVPMLMDGFSRHGEKNPIKAPEIVKTFNEYLEKKNIPYKLSEVKLRKFCHHIRSQGLLPLIANSSGYFVSYDPKIIKEQMESLKQRANSINNCVHGLQKCLNLLEIAESGTPIELSNFSTSSAPTTHNP